MFCRVVVLAFCTLTWCHRSFPIHIWPLKMITGGNILFYMVLIFCPECVGFLSSIFMFIFCHIHNHHWYAEYRVFTVHELEIIGYTTGWIDFCLCQHKVIDQGCWPWSQSWAINFSSITLKRALNTIAVCNSFFLKCPS